MLKKRNAFSTSQKQKSWIQMGWLGSQSEETQKKRSLGNEEEQVEGSEMGKRQQPLLRHRLGLAREQTNRLWICNGLEKH